MNGDLAPRAVVNQDGSLDVWIGNHQVRFPPGDRKPTVVEDAIGPPADAGAPPDDVLFDLSPSVPTVSRGGWYVRFGLSGVEINRTMASRPRPGRRYFSRAGRNGR
jgi:hypothetical protein